MATSTNNTTPSWHAIFPAPRSTPASIRREDVLDMMKQSAESSDKDFFLVDLRRNDYEVMLLSIRICMHKAAFLKQGGTIRDAINLPAQSLYPTIPTLYSLFRAAGRNKIIWYCCRLNPRVR
jgi:arsenical-resistance protein 2